MKIAVYSEFTSNNSVETDLSRRICQAADNLGWQAINVRLSSEIRQFKPDFVIVLQCHVPKLTEFPTYGYLGDSAVSQASQTTTNLQRINEKTLKNILSYDGYLSPSSQIDTWLSNLLKETNKKYFIVPFQMSSRQYSLESLLLGITPHHQKLIIEKGFVPYTDHQLANQLTHQSTKKSVEIIVRVGGRPIHFLKRCLDSIAHQTYQNIGIVIVKYQEIAGLENLLKQYTDRLFIKVIETQFSGFRSTQLMAGINAVTSEYFGILDDDDLIHPNHVFLLVSLLESSSHLGVAYSGSIRVWESDKSDRIQKHKRFDKQDNQHNPYYETAKLHYFEDFSLKKILRFKNFISSNSFIAKRSLLCDEFNFDPQLKVGEDFFVLLNLCRRANFVFSYEATCEFYWRQSKRDNSSFDSDWVWEESVNRIKYLFEGKSFANSLYLVRSSKFWQLKVLWIKLKRLALAFWDRVR